MCNTQIVSLENRRNTITANSFRPEYHTEAHDDDDFQVATKPKTLKKFFQPLQVKLHDQQIELFSFFLSFSLEGGAFATMDSKVRARFQ